MIFQIFKDEKFLNIIGEKFCGKSHLINIFLEKQIGVAEHIDYVATAEKKVDTLATAMDKLEALKSIF